MEPQVHGRSRCVFGHSCVFLTAIEHGTCSHTAAKQLFVIALTLCVDAFARDQPPQTHHQHNNRRSDDENELRFGVVDEVLYGTKTPAVAGAQWTGIVTSIALTMLETGAVDAVVCVQSDPNDRYGVCVCDIKV